MFKYRYCIEAYTKPLYAGKEQFEFINFCNADKVEETVKKTIEQMKQEMSPSTKIISFKIIRITETEHFFWGEKVLFEWHPENYPYI